MFYELVFEFQLFARGAEAHLCLLVFFAMTLGIVCAADF
jgi:hypothetical protein